MNMRNICNQLSSDFVNEHLPVTDCRLSSLMNSHIPHDFFLITVASERIRNGKYERARRKEGGRERTVNHCKAVVIIVARSDCSSTCELSVQIAATVHPNGRNARNIPRRYIPRTPRILQRRVPLSFSFSFSCMAA